MHEFSIVRSLLARAESEARAHDAVAVRRIRLRIGELSGVETDLLISAYEILRPGSLCNGAELEVERIPASWSCPECAQPIQPGAVLTCPICQTPARLTSGSEMLLQQIEMEVA